MMKIILSQETHDGGTVSYKATLIDGDGKEIKSYINLNNIETACRDGFRLQEDALNAYKTLPQIENHTKEPWPEMAHVQEA